MAKIYPNTVNDFHNSYGEFQIFESLKKLPDDWYVYYSLNWQKRSDNGRIVWGEADFVVFNKNYGILVFEVKSGGISFADGQWYQTRLDNNEVNEMKNPFNQANRSKYKLIDEIDYSLSNGDRCFIDKAVWFPSINNEDLVRENLPLEYNKNLILTKESLENPLNGIVSIFNYYNSLRYNRLSNESVSLILNILGPTFDLVASSSNIKDEANYVFYQLTNEQKKVLEFIEDQQTVAIQGAAGTGKTFIAVEQAKRLANTNNKVLFLCFNKFLYLHLSKMNNIKNIEYYNIHTFLSKFSSNDLASDEKCLKALQIIDFCDLNYSAIIIDEAQDISTNILNYIFDICIKLNLKYYLFYDKNQMLYQKKLPKCIEQFDCKLTLNRNCRNTLKIVRTINSVFNTNTKANDFSINGIIPSFYFSNNQVEVLYNIINQYQSEGFSLDDITILTLLTEDESCLKNVSYINKYLISNEKSNNTIFFTTSKKFKGLESNAIIVVDFNANCYDDYEYQKNFYVAISRARQRLSIICNNLDDLNLLATKIDGNLDSNIKVARKFKVKIEE